MVRLITKFKYLKPHHEKSIGGYAKYIATREGVEKIDDSVKHAPASQKQQQLVRRILKDFSDTKDMLEYEDYLRNPTVGTASEFISRALEDNAHTAVNRKTYADYIATRPRAERIGSHGLFTDEGVHVQLSKVSEELNHHNGNVWTIIISLRREDAERLGFSSGARWRDMLRTQTQAIANNFKIPIENLRWYASFHNESHHPHAHVIVYSKVENECYLTKKGVHNLRSSFAKDIFVHDLETAYEKQKTYRDDLRLHGRELIAEIVSQINSGAYDNPALEEKLLNLADRLSRTGGKKQYGYLKADVKAIVDSIVNDLAGEERIAALYDLWYQQREEVIRTYTDEIPQRIALTDNKEFKTIKNAVIREAMNIVAERTLADEDDGRSDVDSPEVDPDLYVPSDDTVQIDPEDSLPTEKEPDRKKSWWTDAYKQARTFLYGTKDTPPDLEGQLRCHENGVHPMQVKLKLFFEWGIQFDEDNPYTVPEHGNRKVEYAEKKEIMDGIVAKYHPDWLEEPMPADDSDFSGGQDHVPAEFHEPQHHSPRTPDKRRAGGGVNPAPVGRKTPLPRKPEVKSDGQV